MLRAEQEADRLRHLTRLCFGSNFSNIISYVSLSKYAFFFVNHEMPILFPVNCERTNYLYFVQRDLDPPPPYHPLYCGFVSVVTEVLVVGLSYFDDQLHLFRSRSFVTSISLGIIKEVGFVEQFQSVSFLSVEWYRNTTDRNTTLKNYINMKRVSQSNIIKFILRTNLMNS